MWQVGSRPPAWRCEPGSGHPLVRAVPARTLPAASSLRRRTGGIGCTSSLSPSAGGCGVAASWSQGDHDLAVDVPSRLQVDGRMDLLYRKACRDRDR